VVKALLAAIRSSEEQAACIAEEAKARAHALVFEAKDKASSRNAHYAREAKKTAQAQEEKAAQETAQELERIKKETARAIEGLRRHYARNKEKAIAHIMQKLQDYYGSRTSK